MSIFASSGAKLYIGSQNSDPDTVLADYQADSFIEVAEVESLGDFGDESGDITFTSLSDARVKHLKGPRDAGSMPIVVGDDMTDAGQTAMEAAEASPLDFTFKVVLNNAITVGGSGSEHYFIGKVMSKKRAVGSATDVTKKNFTVGINSPVVEQDPT